MVGRVPRIALITRRLPEGFSRYLPTVVIPDEVVFNSKLMFRLSSDAALHTGLDCETYRHAVCIQLAESVLTHAVNTPIRLFHYVNSAEIEKYETFVEGWVKERKQTAG